MKVHVIFDLGWNDQMSMILVQRHLSELRVIDYIEVAQDAGLVQHGTARQAPELGQPVAPARWRAQELPDRQVRPADHAGVGLDG
jgi:hypothetical protein